MFARVLDGLLMVIAVALPIFVLPFVLAYLALLVFVLYHPLMLRRRGAHNGQTLGKQVLGIRVVRADGGAVSGGAAASREILGVVLLGLVPFYALVDAMMVPFAERGRSIHDRIADTLVVRVGAEAPHWTGRPASVPTGYGASPDSAAPFSRPAPAPQAPAVAAGWYADPSGSGRQRWWDGTSWTSHVD